MLDTLAIVRNLMDADIEQRSAEAIAEAIRNGQAETASKDFIRGEMGELRVEMAEFRTEVRGDIGELRVEMAEFRAEVRGEMGELRVEMGELRGEMGVRLGELQSDFAKRINGLQRWMIGMMFGFIATILTQILF